MAHRRERARAPHAVRFRAVQDRFPISSRSKSRTRRPSPDGRTSYSSRAPCCQAGAPKHGCLGRTVGADEHASRMVASDAWHRRSRNSAGCSGAWLPATMARYRRAVGDPHKGCFHITPTWWTWTIHLQVSTPSACAECGRRHHVDGMLAIFPPGVGPFIAAGPIMAALQAWAPVGPSAARTARSSDSGCRSIRQSGMRGGCERGGFCCRCTPDDQEWAHKGKQILEETGAEDISSTAETKGDFSNADRPTALVEPRASRAGGGHQGRGRAPKAARGRAGGGAGIVSGGAVVFRIKRGSKEKGHGERKDRRTEGTREGSGGGSDRRWQAEAGGKTPTRRWEGWEQEAWSKRRRSRYGDDKVQGIRCPGLSRGQDGVRIGGKPSRSPGARRRPQRQKNRRPLQHEAASEVPRSNREHGTAPKPRL